MLDEKDKKVVYNYHNEKVENLFDSKIVKNNENQHVQIPSLIALVE